MQMSSIYMLKTSPSDVVQPCVFMKTNTEALEPELNSNSTLRHSVFVNSGLVFDISFVLSLFLAHKKRERLFAKLVLAQQDIT